MDLRCSSQPIRPPAMPSRSFDAEAYPRALERPQRAESERQDPPKRLEEAAVGVGAWSGTGVEASLHRSAVSFSQHADEDAPKRPIPRAVDWELGDRPHMRARHSSIP